MHHGPKSLIFSTCDTRRPLGLVSLGSNHVDGYADYSANAMQGARYESGLDNSPMYDGDFFDANVSGSAEGAAAVGQMRLYDVGFASMVAMEAEALAAAEEERKRQARRRNRRRRGGRSSGRTQNRRPNRLNLNLGGN